MKIQNCPSRTRLICLIAASLLSFTVCADTVLDFDAIPPGQFHNAPIIQSFGDFASGSSPGVTVTGIGTPDIDLTWSAVSATANPATRWDYYNYPGPPQPEPWTAAQLNQSWPGDYHDLKFVPANSAKVVVKSFNFHGYYGILHNPTNGLDYQERFTYNWAVLDANSLASLVTGSYTFLSDSNKNHPVLINYTGSNNQPLILRLTRVASTLGGTSPIEIEGDGADIAVDDITFSEEIGAANVTVTSVSPANGETNASPEFAYVATIQDGYATQAATNTIQLKLDGVPLPPAITRTGLVTTVRFNAGGLIRNHSTNKYTLTFNDTAGSPGSYTNESTFVVRFAGYEWRFTQGDLSPALGNGEMIYADPFGETASITTFGTTDGGTVPHINGVPAKYMHVPGFNSFSQTYFDADGYLLKLNDSGPNVGTNAYINRYSIVFDLLVPGVLTDYPQDYIVPFFNTDPFNLNDADFYMRTNGSVGIGGGGYSNPGVVTANTWNRVVFVCDLVANTLTYYVNGVNVKSRAADGLGGRWSLYSSDDVGPSGYPGNILLFNEGDTSDNYTHELYLSSVAFTDRALNGSEAAGLSGARSTGILTPSFAPKPSVAIQRSGGNAVISWPSNYVGYALESRSSLSTGTWLPVPGVTNNAITIPAAGSQFFRLAQ